MPNGDDERMWTPPTGWDVADDNPKVISNHLRALKAEMHFGFESVTEALKVFGKIDAKLDVIIDRQNHTDRRVDALELRVAALEAKPKRRAAPRKK